MWPSSYYPRRYWPAGYWPQTEAPADNAAWEKSLESFQRDLQAMQDLVADPKTDLFAKLPWGDGQTVLREAMMLADHNAYHLGQIVSVRQALELCERLHREVPRVLEVRSSRPRATNRSTQGRANSSEPGRG